MLLCGRCRGGGVCQWTRSQTSPLRSQADVNVKLVMGLRSNVKKRVNIADVPAGLNVRRLIEKAVYDEMVSMLDRCASQQGRCGLTGNLQADWTSLDGSNRSRNVLKPYRGCVAAASTPRRRS